MGFGIRMMTKAWARVRAFVAPRRSRVVNSDEKEGLRNPGVVVRRRAARELWGGAEEGAPLRVSGAAFARRPRHDENNPIFDKIRQIHAFIPQIRAFIRQIQDPSERGKNIKSLKIKGLCEKEAPGEVISQGRGVCAHPPALAPRRGPGTETDRDGASPPEGPHAGGGPGVPPGPLSGQSPKSDPWRGGGAASGASLSRQAGSSFPGLFTRSPTG